MYESDNFGYSITDFIEKYQMRLPMMAVVIQGFFGRTKNDTVSTGQLLRIHCVQTIPRVKAKIVDDQEGRFQNIKTISLPVSSKQPIYVQTKKGKTKSLIEISKKGEFPCKITLTDTYYLNQRDNTSLRIDPSVSLVLEGQADLRYLLGNPVTGVELLNYPVILPEYIRELELAAVIGIKGFDYKQWQQLQTYMSDVVKRYVRFEQETFLGGLIALSELDTSTYTNHTNEYLQCIPSEYDKRQGSSLSSYIPLKQHATSENVYDVIPDNRHADLSTLSREWKQRLNITVKNEPVQIQYTGHQAIAASMPNESVLNQKAPKVSSRQVVAQNIAPPLPRRDKQISNPGDMFEKRLPDIDTMTIADIGRLLHRLNLDSYVHMFADSLVDGVILKEFNEEILKDFGFSRLEIIRLMKFIQCGHVPK
ncbi:uncharacterized protein LOC127731967 isoform X2 [Mytilus californianus]|uniref:uncharacterized protein LOC127731967 isoform X2 n=1 Tax=Mytilus californianus TaxID=6549 RepID=UPI0022455762|nr:uncharacterized protein LOC127731967 isoform X2 [Mytilus californianus]